MDVSALTGIDAASTLIDGTRQQASGQLTEPGDAPGSDTVGPSLEVAPVSTIPSGTTPPSVATVVFRQVGTFFSSVASYATAQTSSVATTSTDASSGTGPETHHTSSSTATDRPPIVGAQVPSIRFKGKAARTKTARETTSFNPYLKGKGKGKGQPEDVTREISRILREGARTLVNRVTGSEHATSAPLVTDPVHTPSNAPFAESKAPDAAESTASTSMPQASASPSSTPIAVHTSDKPSGSVTPSGPAPTSQSHAMYATTPLRRSSPRRTPRSPHSTPHSSPRMSGGSRHSGSPASSPSTPKSRMHSSGVVSTNVVISSNEDSKEVSTRSKSDSMHSEMVPTSSKLVTMSLPRVDSTRIKSKVSSAASVSSVSSNHGDDEMLAKTTKAPLHIQDAVTPTSSASSKTGTPSIRTNIGATVGQASISTPPRGISADRGGDDEAPRTLHKRGERQGGDTGNGKLPALNIDSDASDDSYSGQSTPVPQLPQKRIRQQTPERPLTSTAKRSVRSGSSRATSEDVNDVLATLGKHGSDSTESSCRGGHTSSGAEGSNASTPHGKYGLGSAPSGSNRHRRGGRPSEEDDVPPMPGKYGLSGETRRRRSEGSSRDINADHSKLTQSRPRELPAKRSSAQGKLIRDVSTNRPPAKETDAQLRFSEGIALPFAEHSPPTAGPSGIHKAADTGSSASSTHASGSAGDRDANLNDRAVCSFHCAVSDVYSQE